VGALPVNAGGPSFPGGAVAYSADGAGQYHVVGGANAVADPNPPIQLVVLRGVEPVSATVQAAPDGSFDVVVSATPGDLLALAVTDGHPEALSSTLELGAMPDLVAPWVEPGLVTIAAHDRSFWVAGGLGTVTDDLAVTEAHLDVPSAPAVALAVAADGSFGETAVASSSGTVLTLVARDAADHVSSAPLAPLPANVGPPVISAGALVLATPGVYAVEGVFASGHHALESPDGLENVVLENRTTPGFGPWTVTPAAAGGIGYAFAPVTVAGALGDEIWLVAEDGHPEWLSTEAQVWTLPQISGAPVVDLAADDLVYAGGAYHLAIPAGAVTGDPAPLEVVAQLWRFDGASWSAVGGASASTASGEQGELELIGGAEGNLVVVSVTDAGNRTTTRRLGNLPPAADLTVSFESAQATASERAGSIQLAVTLSMAPPGTVTVGFATADGTAVAGTDYEAVAGQLTFTPTVTSRTVSVAILDDAVEEGTESFSVTLSNPSFGLALGAVPTVAVAIADNEGEPREVDLSVRPGAGWNMLPGPIGVSVTQGQATFTSPLPDGPDRGDRLTLSDGQEVYLGACSDDFHCEVRTSFGVEPTDLPSGQVTAVYPAFTSLAQAVSQAGGVLGSTDLVSANLALNLVCYAGLDEQPVSISGWTTSPEHFIRVVAPLAYSQRGGRQRHSGRWDEGAYRLDVNGTCVTASVGNLILEGLQLHCWDGPDEDLFGIHVVGPAVSGFVDVGESIVRLDEEAGSGLRVGVEVDSYSSPTDLNVRSSLLYDLGDGPEGTHAGIRVWSDRTTLRASANTIVGGAHGIYVDAPTWATAKSNLVIGATQSCYGQGSSSGGTAWVDCSHNLSSDATAPGPAAARHAEVTFVGETTGPGADLHLECDVDLDEVTVTHTPVDIGSVADLFDGDQFTLARSEAVNPAWYQVELPTPRSLTGTGVALSHADLHRWMVAAADSVDDMASQSGSYQEIVPWREVPGHRLWDAVALTSPVTSSVLRLSVQRLVGDDYVHVNEWRLDGLNPACGRGLDLSADPDLPVVLDVDGSAFVAPADIGADQTDEVLVGFETSYYLGWETEVSVDLDIVLSAPAPIPVSVRYRTYEGSATSGVDFSPLSGTAVFAPGATRHRVTLPVVDDGPGEGEEDLVVALGSPAGCRLRGDWTDWASVVIREGSPPPRGSFEATQLEALEGAGTVEVMVTLDQPATETTWLEWRVLTGRATAGLDFYPHWGSVTFQPGEWRLPITLTLDDDQLLEGTETVVLELVWVGSAELASVNRTATLAILDDDLREANVSPSLCRLDLDGCTPRLETAPGAVGGTSPTLTVEVLVDNPESWQSDWSSGPFTLASGAPFQVDLGDTAVPVDLGATVTVAAIPDAGGDPASAVVATIPSVPPAVDGGQVVVTRTAAEASVSVPAAAVTDRLAPDLFWITLRNVATGLYDGVDDVCWSGEPDYAGYIAAEVGEEVQLQLCNGEASPVCTDWISLGDGTK